MSMFRYVSATSIILVSLGLMAFPARAQQPLDQQLEFGNVSDGAFAEPPTAQSAPSRSPSAVTARTSGWRRTRSAAAERSSTTATRSSRRVSAGRHTGEVSRVSPDGRQFWLVNERSGAEQLIDAEFWRARAHTDSTPG